MGDNADYKTYGLPRDTIESSRLNDQHESNKSIAGYLIHPRIVSSLPSDAAIADVGTGTGIWLQDVAATFPPSTPSRSGWTYTGLDVSAAQFPRAENSRATTNCTYHTLDILQPIPEAFQGKFHLVHMRYLVLALNTQDFRIATAHARDLLQPGGWIQWQEPDYYAQEVLQSVPGVTTFATDVLQTVLFKYAYANGKLLSADIRALPDVVREEGLEDVMVDITSSDRDPTNRLRSTSVVQRATLAILWLALAHGDLMGEEWSQEKLLEMQEKALAEQVDGKVYIRWTMKTLTARKKI